MFTPLSLGGAWMRGLRAISRFSGMAALFLGSSMTPLHGDMILHDNEYFSTQGLDVLVFNNWYDGNFSDSKISGIEVIHHDVRTVTNGDVRLSPTPEQWDPVPDMIERRVLRDETAIEADLAYPKYNFTYTIRSRPIQNGVEISVHLEKPLPEALIGKAGFNLEFLPSAYWGKSYLIDGHSGQLARHPTGPTGRAADGSIRRLPLAEGNRLVLAPEDPQRHISIDGHGAILGLYDGRNQAQNGWYVVRSLLPAEATGEVLRWTLTANTSEGWTRPTVIGHSQVGYHPAQRKVAVLERDLQAKAPEPVSLLRVSADGSMETVLSAQPEHWGQWLRYDYYTFDFSKVREEGIYLLEADGQRTHAFRIGEAVFSDIWHATLDVFFPVQMDHMRVREAYRVWHGASHLDDALQAPVNHEHFDLYRMGPTTDTQFEPGEHIPGLNIGGWYDAGDYDIRTQSQYYTVQHLVMVWEQFRPTRDETTVQQERRSVYIHQPDGIPDILQQIEHGTLALIAQYRAVGHAIPGIVEPDLRQYTHLGDGMTKTDNKIYDPSLGPDEVVGDRSGRPDDRWAFTTNTTALNYGSAAALAAASRALRGYRDELADECLETALRVWDFEQSREPNLFRHGNTTGGLVDDEELKLVVELLLTTGEQRFADRLAELWDTIDERFAFNAVMAARALPQMDSAFAKRLRERTRQYLEEIVEFSEENPYAVPITRFGWAGNGRIIGYGITNYFLHQAFPDLVGVDDTLRSVDYLLGCHPANNHSFVSGVGAQSRDVAYGMNRADFSFIPGGIVPGVLVIQPDFPENKEDWPFFWGQNEYVISIGGSYLFLSLAAQDLLSPSL